MLMTQSNRMKGNVSIHKYDNDCKDLLKTRAQTVWFFFFFSFESKWQWNGMTYNFKWSYWMRKTWNGNIFFNSLRPSQSSLHAIFGNGIVIMDAININRNCSLSIFCNTCHTINTHQLQMFDQLKKKKKNISMENLCFLFYPLVISLCFVLGTCQKRREKGFLLVFDIRQRQNTDTVRYTFHRFPVCEICDAYGIFNSNLCRPLDDSMILFKVKTTWWRIKITVFFLLLHFCLFCVSLNIYSCVALATVELFDRRVFPFFSSLFYCTPNSFTCWNIFRLSNGFWNVCSVHPSYAINKSMAQTKTDSIPSIFFLFQQNYFEIFLFEKWRLS